MERENFKFGINDEEENIRVRKIDCIKVKKDKIWMRMMLACYVYIDPVVHFQYCRILQICYFP